MRMKNQFDLPLTVPVGNYVLAVNRLGHTVLVGSEDQIAHAIEAINSYDALKDEVEQLRSKLTPTARAFEAGTTYRPDDDDYMWTSGISLFKYTDVIECHAYTEEAAVTLRDEVLKRLT